MTQAWSVIVLAAGKGTRMNAALPKVLHPVMGKPLLHHVLHIADVIKPHSVITVLSPELKDIPLPPFCQRVIQDPPLGTGHGVQIALEALTSLPDSHIVVVMAGDVPALQSSSLQKVLDLFHKEPFLKAVVVGMTVQGPHAYGRLIVEGNNLKDIVESKEATPEQKSITLCNSGILAFQLGALRKACQQLVPSSASKELYLTDTIKLIEKSKGKLTYIIVDPEEAKGVNTQEDLAELEAILQKRTRLVFLSKGVRMIAPETVYFSHDTVIEPDVVIEPYVVFGQGVCVKRYSVIHSFSYLEGCVMDQKTSVGPFARLRQGTHLNSHSKIGNFVEVKNTTLGTGSKLNHLSYVGDATVGSHVNIGAGVVTCNYDGYTKQATLIDDYAFIGSNTSLIAPVQVGKEALVGAGSTITKGVPAGCLALGRAKQVTIEQGALKRKTRLQANKEKLSGDL